jgi:DNA-binding MarR family transcriptional regulator
MPGFDPVIHQPVRLRIMAMLCGLGRAEAVDFSTLKESLDLTEGNLGAHLTTLENAGHVSIEKTFVARRPKTFVRPTADGRRAFDAHDAALEAMLKPLR